jgi:Zn-dependent protease with chaperone function
MMGGNDVFSCPRCAAISPADPRFVSWCQQCGFNADPDPPSEPKGRLRARAIRKSEQRVREEYQRCSKAADLRTLHDSWRPMGQVAAILVHITTATLLAGAVFIALSSILTALKVLLVALFVGAAFEVRPRFGKLPKGPEIRRDHAPVLWSVIEEACSKVGARRPDAVYVDGRFNAHYGMYGLRRRRCLVLGYPMWNVLGAEERLALLGHELAHDVNHDLRNGALVATALNSINHWLLVLSMPPRTSPSASLTRRKLKVRASAPSSIERAVPLAFLPLFGIVLIFGTCLRRISDKAAQRAEYLADDLACSIAGKASTTTMLGTELVGRSCLQSLITASRQGESNLWRSEREFIESIPQYELIRRRRIAASRLIRTDYHPPVDLRMRLMEERPPSTCQAPHLANRMSDIDHELLPWSQELELSIRKRHPVYVSTSRVTRSNADISSLEMAGSIPVSGSADPEPSSA